MKLPPSFFSAFYIFGKYDYLILVMLPTESYGSIASKVPLSKTISNLLRNLSSIGSSRSHTRYSISILYFRLRSFIYFTTFSLQSQFIICSLGFCFRRSSANVLFPHPTWKMLEPVGISWGRRWLQSEQAPYHQKNQLSVFLREAKKWSQYFLSLNYLQFQGNIFMLIISTISCQQSSSGSGMADFSMVLQAAKPFQRLGVDLGSITLLDLMHISGLHFPGADGHFLEVDCQLFSFVDRFIHHFYFRSH